MKFLQISDIHLVPEGELLYGLDPGARLAACIDDINRHHGDAEFAIITGDLAHTGNPHAYARLRGMLGELAMPYHLLIGNHDSRENFRAAFPERPVDADGFVQFTLAASFGRIVALDTNVPGQPYGAFCAKRCAWLARTLDAAGETPVYLFMHHPPMRVGLKRMDVIGLRDADAFAKVIAGRRNIRHLFFGHLHRLLSGCWHGVPFANLPGTSHQVALDFVTENRVPGSHEPPAYAVVLAEPDATLVHLRNFLDRTNTFLL